MTDDFYEDDEPVEDVARAFDAGEKYVTERLLTGMTRRWADVTAELRSQPGDDERMALARERLLDDMVREAAELGLYESTDRPMPPR